MKVFELIPLTAAIVNFALIIAVFSRGPRAALNQVFAFWGAAIVTWNLGVFFVFRSTDPVKALFWARFLQIGVIFLPIGLYHLSMIIARVKNGWNTRALYLLGVLFVVADFSDYFISGVRNAGYAYYSVAGPAFWLFLLIYINNAIRCGWMLYQRQKSVSSLHRTRLRWLLVATIILVIFGSNDILPIIGLDKYPILDVRIYPLGSLAAIFYGLIVAYSVLQYQLLDIHVTLSRFAAQLVRLGFMSLTSFLLLLLVANAAPAGQFTPFAFFSALGVLIISALLASFLFPQFFGKGTDALERHILGDRFEYQNRVQNFIQDMRSFPDPESLVQELEDLLASTVKVRSYQIILQHEISRCFTLYCSLPPRPQTDLQADSPVFEYFRQAHHNHLSCKPDYDNVFESSLQQKARDQLRPFEPEFCFPLFAGNELVGLMLLGPKSNQDLFTPHDLRLLSQLASDLGPILNQIRLRNQLQQAHEQDLLGRMSRGLAHDLNNLLTPAHTLLQLFQEAQINQETINELLPMALHNLATVRTYVNEALFFSRTASLNGHPESLPQTIRRAIATVQRNSEAKKVKLVFLQEEDTVIEMDAVLIQRLIGNLLSNAIDASPPGTDIEVTISMLPSTELSREWYRIRIIDHGEGISPENLKRVTTPYFTTKDTGDGNRGFGLGLAIARKIIHLHGGNLSIASKEKIGTTVQVDLPSKLTLTQAQQKTTNGKAEFKTVTA